MTSDRNTVKFVSLCATSTLMSPSFDEPQCLVRRALVRFTYDCAIKLSVWCCVSIGLSTSFRLRNIDHDMIM